MKEGSDGSMGSVDSKASPGFLFGEMCMSMKKSTAIYSYFVLHFPRRTCVSF